MLRSRVEELQAVSDTETESLVEGKDEAWDDWDDEFESNLICLFCPESYKDTHILFNHIATSHGFDFLAFKKDQDLDFYQSIRLINYIRQKVLDCPELQNTVSFSIPSIDEFIDCDCFLKPVLENDSLLFEFDHVDTEEFLDPNQEMVDSSCPVKAMEEKLKLSESKCEAMQSAFSNYKKMVQETFFDVESCSESGSENENNTSYFASYDAFDIHEDMIKDKPRTESYMNFMLNNPQLFRDKVVLDVGCGTGILSMFAAKAGAKKVFSVDNSNIISYAKHIIAENHFSDIITCIQGKIEQVQLPVEKVDIIISEWMGYFLIYESMLDSVLFARDKYLKPEGIMCPSHAEIFLSGLDDHDLYQSRFDFWNDIYGLKMSCIRQKRFREAVVNDVQGTKIITNMVSLVKYILNQVDVKELDFSAHFQLQCQRQGQIHAFVGHFDTLFSSILENTKQELLSTSPETTLTHWKQTLFFLEQPITVQSGDIISGTLHCKKNPQNPRVLDIAIECSYLDHSTELFISKTQFYELH